MSDTPEDTELKKDFNQLLVQEFTTDWKTQRLIMELNIDVMSLDNLMNIITLHTQKAKYNAVNDVINHSFGEWNGADYAFDLLAQLTNPTKGVNRL